MRVDSNGIEYNRIRNNIELNLIEQNGLGYDKTQYNKMEQKTRRNEMQQHTINYIRNTIN